MKLTPEEVSLSVPGLRVRIEPDGIEGDLEEVDRFTVVFRQVPDKFVLVRTRQIQNVMVEHEVFLKKSIVCII